MITVPISGTNSTVSFFEDDTIDTVRKLIALAVNSHPDRLFIEVREEFPKNWYENPKHWSALYYRMAYNGKDVSLAAFKTYLTQIRMLTDISAKDISQEDWEARNDDFRSIFSPEKEFLEWRILGAENSMILPLPPKDLIDLKPAYIPLPKLNVLFETIHTHAIKEIRVSVIPEKPSQLMMRSYYPYFKEDTPINIEEFRSVIVENHNRIEKLLKLDVPVHKRTHILKIKWYIPLISTHFSAPHVRFEQIFYGMAVNENIPYVGYFTSQNEKTRHKFFVENPKTKIPKLDTTMWKSWFSNTKPQRKLPTLLFYRGAKKTTFDRIAITNKDITITCTREDDSTETMEEMKKSMTEWLMTFDAFVPFFDVTDMNDDRWKLEEISAIAGYENKVNEFDMRRYACLKNIFGHDSEKDIFRFLRADAVGEFSNLEISAFQVLKNADNPSAEFLANEMKISIEQARVLMNKIADFDEDFDIEKSMKQYPVIKFSQDEVIVNNVKSLERVLHYIDILRFVLTTEKDTDELNEVCPRPPELVEPVVTVPIQNVDTEFVYDADLMAEFGLEEEEAPPVEAPVAAPAPVAAIPKKIQIKEVMQNTTYDYFNTLIKKFDPAINPQYPKKCDKLNQVIVLTKDKRRKLGPKYNYEDASEKEKIDIKSSTGEDGIAICPLYWCVRDEIPLREEQLIVKEDGKHCPVCDGKVRITDKENLAEFSVIQRNFGKKYPQLMKSISVPCCYMNPRKNAEVLQKGGTVADDVTYILGPEKNIKALRLAYLPAGYLGIKTNYKVSVTNSHLNVNATDMFRIGIGRPSKTLPTLLGIDRVIPNPKDAIDNLKLCSFFRTWSNITEQGETLMERIVNSISVAFERGELKILDEIEYVTSILNVQVIRVIKNQVVCGFWSETLSPKSKTIVITETGDVIGRATRSDKKSGFKYDADIRKEVETYAMLNKLHIQACASNVPHYQDAIKEVISIGKPKYELIGDPFGRVQAVFVVGQAIYPFQPTTLPTMAANVRNGYEEIKTEELPQNLDYLENTIHPGFKLVQVLANSQNQIVEGLLASGFRVPIQPQQSEEPLTAKEIIETIRRHSEKDLIEAPPNASDRRLAEQTSYREEVFQFLLFSLSKDIQREENASLRESIEKGKESLYKDLEKWLESESYMDDAQDPIQFLNKIREPCGQMEEASCKKSSMCGWYNNSCKIKIKNTMVDKGMMLRRLVKTLKENDKQRSLVLDERLSPFFSTILYLEMPNELITTDVA